MQQRMQEQQPAGTVPDVVVVGPGAVGGYYAARLALAGRAVGLVGRPSLVAAVRQHGLLLTEGGRTQRAAVHAGDDPAGVRGAPLVLVAVKSTDTAAVADAIAPHVRDDALVLSLQNGIDNVALLRARLRARVEGLAVYLAAGLDGPGRVRHEGRGELVCDASVDAHPAIGAMRAAGLRIDAVPDVRAAQWEKLVINCAWNALSAVARAPYAVLHAAPGIAALMDRLVDEALAVARAEGVALDEAGLRQRMHAIAGAMPAQHSSTAQDLMRGRVTEIAFLNGAIVRAARRHGLDAPLNEAMSSLVTLLHPPGAA